MISQIGLEDIEDLAAGSTFLGTGGGGDPYLGSLLCHEAITQHGPVPLLDPAKLADDDAVFVAAAMGAPTVMIEKLLSIDDQDRAVRALERYLGRTATAVIALEIGGCNSMMPVAYAAMRGLPIVDGDGMGRAFPKLQMTSMNINGIRCAPMALGDEHGNVVMFETADGQKAEELARPVVAAMGAAACLSCYSMTGTQSRTAVVPQTLSGAISIGRAINGKSHADRAPVDRLIAALCELPLYGDGRCAFEGKIVSIERDTRDGWVFGTCTVKALEGKSAASIDFQNENLNVRVDGALRCIVPDLVTIVDTESGHAIPTERLAYGQRVSVIVCAAPTPLVTPAALAVVGPKEFGLDTHYQPLASLMD